ncbi:branched-chain-amino-acid transaminase [Kiritimatiella glycovorans]|uniref:Branched-chain-amino-acid aminotransferase n=1 Tax=Kiritimatiella glycovorans TaxID=1307763 RepID=A0A0G3EG80_9BACT|nr:branched-chain-amino-acid transaminase [Kiritimatiella glycovorans]AKJ65343.1 Branched-chain-amino-acid aminotransferase [Kiritimatiella glycovorans]
MQIYMNGEMVPEQEARVSVFDHGLLYGDGVFEGIRAYNGRVFLLREHVDRLYDSARAIALEIPMTREAMREAVLETCRANGIRDGYIRLVVTRGCGTLGLNPYNCEDPQVIIIAAAIQLYPKELYETGLKIVTVGTARNHVEAINPRIKSLNYLNNVLAKIEAINAGVMECLMLNPQGYVAEASGDNVFAVRDGVLATPPTWCGALEGITRGKVMEMARETGYPVEERVMTRYDLYTADEVFLTGTAAELISVVEIDRRRIGTGEPGPVTGELLERFQRVIADSGDPI